MRDMKLVKYWMPERINECLMLVEGDPGDPDLLITAEEAILGDEPAPKIVKVNWEVVLVNGGACTYLDVNRPYVG